jgi:hypothetical protein
MLKITYTYEPEVLAFETQEEHIKALTDCLREDAKNQDYRQRTEYEILGPSEIQVWVMAWPENEKNVIYGKDWINLDGIWSLRPNAKLGFLTAIEEIKRALKEACCRMRNN